MQAYFARALHLSVAVVLTVAHPTAAQTAAVPDSQKVGLVRQILAVTHAADQMLAAIEIAVPAQRAANPRIPAVFWDRFLVQARARRGEIIDSLIPLYSRTFDVADLQAMLQLYQSPFGQRLLQLQPALARESTLLGQRWGARVGADIAQQLAAEGIQIQP